ncbi:MAG TPA: FAD-binding oxidoreductase [Bryobacteraceae bacterium]
MHRIVPESAEELAAVLRECAAGGRTIELLGNGTKRLMGGPVGEAEVAISTAGMRRIVEYEPGDLTVSVEAGMPFGELQRQLREQGQTIALDPPFAAGATVGGIVASNTSGPMRRGFGTARDLVIGMEFAMLDGKLIRTGGMVVKNVAGLDMGKMLIGSFGTLAAITRVNFRLHPLPEQTRTFLFEYADLGSALEKRDAILRGVLQPLTVDLLSPSAAARDGYVLAVRAGGSKAVLERYARELNEAEAIEGREEDAFWERVREFTPTFLARHPEGMVLRVSTTLGDLAAVMRTAPGATIARAATGVAYIHLESWPAPPAVWEQGWSVVVEFAPEEIRRSQELWRLPAEGAKANSFAMMKKAKQMFDPDHLLNRARLYGRI